VAGVVNFIMKKNYQGLDVDGQWGTTEAGDGTEWKFSAIFGTNFADDRGNVTVALEHYTREASLQRNRDFYLKGFADPTTPSNEFFFTGNNYNPSSPIPGFSNNPSIPAISSLFTHGFIPPSGVMFWFNNNGTLFTGGANAFVPGLAGAAGTYRFTGPFDGFKTALLTVPDVYNGNGAPGVPGTAQVLKTSSTDFYVGAPMNRYTMYLDAHYNITPDVTAYIRGNFATEHTNTVLFSTPFITGWGVDIPYDVATGGAAEGHPVPSELQVLLNSRTLVNLTTHAALPGGANLPWELQVIPAAESWFPPRSTVDDNQVYQVVAGVKGKIPWRDFTFDIYGSHGQANSYTQGNGYASLARYQALILQPNWGANATITGNQGAPNFGFGAATVHCTSGFYSTIFEGGTPSQDCVNAITATLQSRTQTEQNVVEFDTQGTIYKAPAGDIKISLGADFRDNYLRFNPDILQSTVSFLDQVAGVYPTSYSDASTSAREGYGELLVPVLADVPGVKRLEIDLGARYSTYTADDHLNNIHISPQGGWTYKVQGDWSVTDWVRFRGGYNLAVRTPNIGELFLNNQEEYAQGAFTAFGDPCSLLATAPFGANPAVNANAASSERICRAQMGPGANVYYALPQTPGAPTPFGFVEQDGNPNLKAEKGHTWTAGVVLSSPWHNPWLNRMHLSVDWYSLKVTDAIETEAVDTVMAACYNQFAADAAAAAVIAAGPECSKAVRNQGTGAQGPTVIQYQNLATIRTSGWDINFDWAAAFADMGLSQVPGQLQLVVLANYLNYFDTQPAPGAPFEHWAGTLGPTLTGTDPGAFRFKTNTTLTYLEGPLSVGITWRWLPHVHNSAYAALPSTTCPGCFQDSHAFHEFDLAATYTFKQNYVLRAGMQNMFNVDPPITGAQAAQFPLFNAINGQGITMESIYDALGRRFYVGLNAKF
jgi:outer membrane receptor protein involved in Fe transport